MCVAGSLVLHQELDDGVRSTILKSGEAIVNPPGVWHTIDVEAPATAFFIIIDGWIKLYRSTAGGDDTVIEVLTKGDSFAVAGAFAGACYLSTAEAVTDARVAP